MSSIEQWKLCDCTCRGLFFISYFLNPPLCKSAVGTWNSPDAPDVGGGGSLIMITSSVVGDSWQGRQLIVGHLASPWCVHRCVMPGTERALQLFIVKTFPCRHDHPVWNPGVRAARRNHNTARRALSRGTRESLLSASDNCWLLAVINRPEPWAAEELRIRHVYGVALTAN